MLIENGALVREQNPVNDPGRYGDSAFETSSYAVARMLLGEYEVLSEVNLTLFVTLFGTIRHPLSPWRENDMTTDNEMPLYMASRQGGLPQQTIIARFARNRGYRTGNNQLISPGYYAELEDSSLLRNLSLIGQALLFKIPYRWSDSKKWFERSEGSSDGYVQWMLVACKAPKLIRRLITKETLIEKISSYYKPEPNSEWLIQTYKKVIERYWNE